MTYTNLQITKRIIIDGDILDVEFTAEADSDESVSIPEWDKSLYTSYENAVIKEIAESRSLSYEFSKVLRIYITKE